MEKCGQKIKFLYNCFRKKIEANEVIQKSPFSRTEIMTLGTVYGSDRKLCMKDIQEHFSINRSTASELLSSLESKGAVVKQPDEFDSRIKYIILTSFGKRWYMKIVAQFEAIDNEFLSCLTEEETSELERLVNKLIKNNILNGEEEKNEKICCCKKKTD